MSDQLGRTAAMVDSEPRQTWEVVRSDFKIAVHFADVVRKYTKLPVEALLRQ